MTDHAIPKCVALVLCQAVVRAPDGACSLHRLTNEIRLPDFPGRVGTVYAYFAVTDGRGKTPIEFVVRDLSRDVVLLEHKMIVEFTDPLGDVDYSIGLGNMPVETPGVYAMELMSGIHHLATRRLRISQGEVPKP